jgi:hypothetical protein
MEERAPLSNRERRRRERKVWRTALLVSFLGHLVIFFAWRAEPVLRSPFAAAGPRAGSDRAAAGSMQAMTLATPPSVPLTPPPIPLPTLTDVEPIEFEEQPSVDPAAIRGEIEGSLTAGIEGGEGEGDAGNSDRGLNRLVPPRPRGMIIPPSDDALRGREVEVWVFVDARGRVVPDSTRLRPPTGNRRLNERLIEEAAEWIFMPATKGGQPVATWYPYRISM